MLDLGFLPDVERDPAAHPAGPADHAVLGHHARRDRHPRPAATCSSPLHVRAEQHDEPEPACRPPSSTCSAPTSWTRSRCWPGSCRPTGRGLTMVFCRTKRTADQVAEALTDAWLRRRRRARRPRPGPARTSAAGVPQRQGRRARGHRRGRPRPGRRGRHPRGELRVPRGRQGLPAPDRPHRPGRPDRRGGHLRGLAATSSAGRSSTRRWASAIRTTRPRPTPPPSTCSARWASRPAGRQRCPAPSVTGPAWRPRKSRTSARPGRPGSPAWPDGGARRGGHGPAAGAGAGRAAAAAGAGPAGGAAVTRPRRRGTAATPPRGQQRTCAPGIRPAPGAARRPGRPQAAAAPVAGQRGRRCRPARAARPWRQPGIDRQRCDAGGGAAGIGR